MTNQILMPANDRLAAAVRGFNQLTGVTRAQLSANKVPLLHVAGERDPLKADVDCARGLAGNAEFVVVPGQDHMTTLTQPMFLDTTRKVFIP